MKYSIANLNDKNYNLIGIKLPNGKTCCYWSNKDSANNFNKITVIFDNKNVVDVKYNHVCISLNGITDKEDILNMIEAFGRELYKIKINITKIDCDFIVDNKNEEEIVDELMNKFMLKGNIIRSDNSYLTQNLDDALNNISVLNDEKIKINKEEKSVHNDIVHEDIEKVEEDDILAKEKQKILSEWMNDSNKLLEISSLSREELDRKLTNAVSSGLKTSYIDSLNNDMNNLNNDMNKYDYERDDTELSESINKYSIVSEVDRLHDDSIEKPSIIEEVNRLHDDSINKHSITSEVYKLNDTSSINDTNINNTSSNVDIANDTSSVNDYFWNDDEELPINRKLSREQSISNKSSSKSKVRVLKKPERPVYPRDDNKGSVSLFVIIFIISLLLLVGSVIILYLMK